MERGGGSHSSSWPATIRTPAHPQHELEYQLLPSNSCNLCCGDIAGEFAYRCAACDFDIHCACLPKPNKTLAQARAAPPLPGPMPSSSVLPTWLPRPRMHLHLNLSAQLNILDHQNDAETTSDVDPSSRQSYHVALQYNSSDDRGEEVADVLAVNYNHLQQQDYPSTDDDGEDNQRARDFGDLDGDDEPRYFGNADGNDEQRDIGNVDGDDEPSNFDIIDAGNYARDSADGDYYGSDMYD
ncbi:unnamed protein product [Urochloa humidicola]